MTTANATAALAAFISNLRYEHIPEDQFGFARRSLLDWLGCCLAGTREDAVMALNKVLEPMSGARQATVIARNRQASVLDAALLNGAAGNLLDLDDVHPALIGHPSSVLAPTVLAVGEWLDASSNDALTAYVAGYETMVRVGQAVEPELYDRGWHATGVLGVFGACAAAARLLGLSAAHTQAALAIAATQAAGLRELFGTSSKCIHHGKAAMAGILACLWAREGVDSAEDIIGGHFGLRTLSEPVRIDAILDGLGTRYQLAQTCYKRHAACGSVHAAIDAAMALRLEPGFSLDNIARIDAVTHKLCYSLTHHNEHAQTGLAAKYSMHFALALALREGRGDLDLFTDEAVADPRVRGLAAKVFMTVDPTMQYIEAMPSQLTIITKDGARSTLRIDAPKGRPSNPMSWDDLADKFTHLALPTLDGTSITRVVEHMADFQNRSIRQLMPLLAVNHA